jgi:hypothetical protein
MQAGPLHNRFAYIPPACYARTRDAVGRAVNPCFVCHVDAPAPNFAQDAELQRWLKFPRAAAENPWTNLLAPPAQGATTLSDADLLAHLRGSNYFDASGELVLRKRLEELPPEWDGDGDAQWGGFVPDAYFRFDAAGFDLRPDGTRSGWRAFAYYPMPGAFFPSNGSAGDVLIRLDPALRSGGRDAREDDLITRVNLAIVEALVTQRDVPIDSVDERPLGVDLDLDGKLTRARRIAFQHDPAGGTRMHYVGRARQLETTGRFPIAPGLFPLNSEFLHTLRYLDVDAGRVRMAARMKEVRYAKKVRWFTADDLQAHAAAEPIERREAAHGARVVIWQFDRGVYNGQGWLLQGFIEDASGALRPQTYEETVFCAGCHGGVGATQDSIFSFARKLPGPAHGYFYPRLEDWQGRREPKRRDGTFEYARYLQENRAGDDFHANPELLARFFDARGELRATELRALHGDVGRLLLPSQGRALALDRAYIALVKEQSFVRGRDAWLGGSQRHVHERVPVGEATGVQTAVGFE